MTGKVMLDVALVLVVMAGIVGLLRWCFVSWIDRPAPLTVAKVDRTLVRRK